MKANGSSRLSTVVWWTLKVSANSDTVGFGLFFVGLIKVLLSKEWRTSSYCLILTVLFFRLISETLMTCAVVNYNLLIKLTYVSVCYDCNPIFIELVQQCLKCALFLGMFTVSDVFTGFVLSETLCIYMLDIYTFYWPIILVIITS